jgi:N-methylhydantoinase A
VNSNSASETYVIGIDTGGTFTDIVVIDQKGRVIYQKSPSTPPDFSAGIMKSYIFNHGMTVATNALINRSGAKTGLITTKGFEDTILIMKARGKCLGLSEMEIKHQPRCKKPEPFVGNTLIRGVTERIDCFGNIVVQLDHKELQEILHYLVEVCKVESIAICTLWSIANPTHEEEIEAIICQKYPEIFVSRSSALIALLGEYERMVTTVFNAYLTPETQKYLANLKTLLADKKLGSSPMIMKADGGVIPIEQAIKGPVFTISSGPAGGVMASRTLGKMLGYENIISTDVGGTSFDVGLIIDGEPLRKDNAVINQYALRLPMIDVTSIGAGGGSVIWYDEVTQTLKVGPQSMGAYPGPACYDMGGTSPTLTDGDLILGILDPDGFAGGRIKLNRDKAIQAMNLVASRLGMNIYETARGARRLACSMMADLIQNQVLFRGYDPRDCVMFLFGGGGPEYGTEYGVQSGVKELLMFPQSPALSALGIATADILHSEIVSELYRMPADPELITRAYERLEEKVIYFFQKAGFNEKNIILTREAQLRYGRQVNYVSVPVKPGRLSENDVKKIMDDFETRYEILFGKGSGYKRAGVELVNLRVYGIIRAPHFTLKKVEGKVTNHSIAQKGRRKVYLDRTFMEAPVFDWDRLKPGNVISGPAIVEMPFSTGILLKDMEGKVDEYLNIHITF